MVYVERSNNYILNIKIRPVFGYVSFRVPSRYVAEIVELLQTKMTYLQASDKSPDTLHAEIRDSFELSGEEFGDQREED